MVRIHGLAVVALGTAQVHAVATHGQCLLQADAKRASLAFGNKLEDVYANSLVGFAVSNEDVQFGKCSDDDTQGDKWWSDLMSKPELREQWDALLIKQEAELGEAEVGAWRMKKMITMKKVTSKAPGLLQEAQIGLGASPSKQKAKMMTSGIMSSGMMYCPKCRVPRQTQIGLGDECCVPASYGEVTPRGVDQLAEVIGATKVAPIASFLDLGSGIGRLAMHMMLAGYARNVTGVELDAGRHHQSEILADRVFSPGRAPRFLQKNMLEVDKLGATVLYMNQQCFPSPETRQKLAERILGGHFGDLQVLVINPDMEEIEESGKYTADESYLELPLQHMDNMTFRVYRRVQPDDM